MWLSSEFEADWRPDAGATLHFTPAEWRAILEDQDFLDDPDNAIRPRRLLGVAVKIVPDHRYG